MMRCDRLQMTLTKPGCARLWEAAARKKPEVWEARSACRNCAIGAANAGKVVVPATVALDEIRMICSRCERNASRLIHADLCVSCYNRHREVLIGRNAKGNRPLLADKLHPHRLVLIKRGSVRIVRTPIVTGVPEAMLSMAKAAGGAVAFGRRRVSWSACVQMRRGLWTPQMELGV
jgi:hypothetical protein